MGSMTANFQLHWLNVGLMLPKRLRRWSSIKPTWFQYVVFAGLATGT